METSEFKKFANTMVDYIADYRETLRDRRVLPNVEPGYLAHLIPSHAPTHGESWVDLMKDIERMIMPGITHWQSPHFHAYFPAGASYPSIVADMLSDAIGCIGFSWISSPACTELEVILMDWLGKMIGLPSQFLASESAGVGGGVIQGSASESTLIALLSARQRAIKQYASKTENKQMTHEIRSRLVAYASEQAHTSVPKAGLLGSVKMRLLMPDKDYCLRGHTLEAAIKEDKAAGLIPFFVVGTLGTTNSLAFDALDEIGQVSKEHGLWVHVDAAYAGSAFICEEFRPLMKGIEKVHSFNFNPHKWLLVNHDCSAMWVKKSSDLVDAHNVDALYLEDTLQRKLLPDFRHWQIPLGRRFRSLKLWFVLRIYGVENLQNYIREQVNLAKGFEALVKEDDRFEIITPAIMGMVCFRLKGSNEENQVLLRTINERGRIHMVPAQLDEKFIIRFVVCSPSTTSQDVNYAWSEIQTVASEQNIISSKD